MVERIVTGPTTEPGVHWLVVLFHSSEIDHDRQQVALGATHSEAYWADYSDEEMRRHVAGLWEGTINEPPGSLLPRSAWVEGGIAWLGGPRNWSPETGPPDIGLPATRVYELPWRPRDPRVDIDEAFERAYWGDSRDSRPESLRYVEVAIDFSGAALEFFFDEQIGEVHRGYAEQVRAETAAEAPPGVTVSARVTFLPPGHIPPPHSVLADPPTLERNIRWLPTRAQEAAMLARSARQRALD